MCGIALKRSWRSSRVGEFKKAVAVDAAQPRELGILEAGNGAEDPHLLGVLQLGLEADDVPQRAERIVLAQLDDRVRPAAGARIVEADRLHRAVAQGVEPARRHHLDRHAAFEVGRVLLPLLELGLLALVQCGDEGVILLAWSIGQLM